MEENKKSSEQQQRQKVAFIKYQIQIFSANELKNVEVLKKMTDQFKTKQSFNPFFQRQEFLSNSHQSFVQIQQFLEKIISKMAIIPLLEGISKILNIIGMQYSQIFKFCNQKWEQEYKLLWETLQDKKNQLHFNKTDLCSNCQEIKWHQQVKEQKHQIFNLKIEDPFYYYNQAGSNLRQTAGQEIDHKKIQDKLSELAFGVQMEQKCLRQMLSNLRQQQEQVSCNLQVAPMQNEPIALPVVPMLRSVFQHVKGPKKVIHQIGVQTIQIPENNLKIAKDLSIPKLNENLEMDKIQYKLITQLTDKTIQIKELQQKIVKAEKAEIDLRTQHTTLLEENVNLQRRNSILQGQLNLSKLKHGNKFKWTDKKKSVERTKQQLGSAINSKYLNQDPNNQQSLMERPAELSFHNKARANGMISMDSKFKMQKAPNKTMFVTPLYNQHVPRQSITPGHQKSALSIQRCSDKLQEEVLSNPVDFPSLKQSFHSNSNIDINEKTSTKFQEEKPENNTVKEVKIQKKVKEQIIKSKRKLKQITKKSIVNQTTNMQSSAWTRSENHSPDTQQKIIRRTGKFQDKQSLLRMLFNSEIKDSKDKSLNFDFFKKSYQDFLLKIVAMNDSGQPHKPSKINYLHKKSTVSIKQNIRYQRVENKEEAISISEEPLMKENSQQSIKNYPKFSTCCRDIMNNLFAEEILVDHANSLDQLTNGRVILTPEQLKLTTQILAYLIQLKVNDINAYTKIRAIISIESGQKKKGSNFTEQSKQLKLSVSTIIKNHRKCHHLEGNSYCKHINSFMKSIVSLMEK